MNSNQIENQNKLKESLKITYLFPKQVDRTVLKHHQMGSLKIPVSLHDLIHRKLPQFNLNGCIIFLFK